MKLRNTLLTGACALVLGGTCFAQSHVYITGSTAYRSNTETAIQRVLDSGYTYAYDGAKGIGGASHAIYFGTLSGSSVIIKTSFSGSEAGIQTVSNSVGVNFLPDSTTATANGGSVNTGGTNTAQAANDSEIPDIAMADTYQGSARASFNVNPLTDNVVGVVPFYFVAGVGAQNGLNMTSNFARALFTTGYAPLSLLTGSQSDVNSIIVATGRDPDSGTRATAFAETGVGIFTGVKQYKPSGQTTNTATDYTKGFGGTATGLAKYPIQVINGISTGSAGNGGEASGGTVAANLTATIPASLGANVSGDANATSTFLVSYLGTGDAAGAFENGAFAMSYNGATLPFTISPSPIPAGTQSSAITVTFDYTNILNGKYTYWGYEHLDTRSSPTAAASSLATALVADFQSTDAQIKTSSMNVQRSADGGPVVTSAF